MRKCYGLYGITLQPDMNNSTDENKRMEKRRMWRSKIRRSKKKNNNKNVYLNWGILLSIFASCYCTTS
jgi:hypothetical protein